MASMKSIIILGGGPAGCECALWLKMLGLSVILIEQTDKLGGLQAHSPYQNNWIVGCMNLTGQMIAQNIERHIKQMEIPVFFNSTITKFERKTKGFTVWIGKKQIQTQHLVIATGVTPRNQDLLLTENVIIGPGEQVFNYDFAGKRVAILGSGDNAAENYTFIKNKRPKLCHVYARTIRARSNLWREVKQQDVFFFPYVIDQTNMKITHQTTVRAYDVFVVLFGWQANFPKALDKFKNNLLNAQGFIATDQYCRTPISGIFAIGEVANRMHPSVVTAMADGIVAAKAIQEEKEGASSGVD